MTTKRQALSPALAAQWAQMAHALYLDALMSEADWAAGELAFHGGTSLRLSWNSPRYSEDLDFLLARTAKGLDQVVRRVETRVQEMARRLDANFVISVKDRTKDPERMPAYMISVSHPGYVGTAKIKAEFWRTDPDYLKRYPTQQRLPGGQLAQTSAGASAGASFLGVHAFTSNPVPAASLETAYADKLVAFATRPFLKWRDLYDLWWIGTQTSAVLSMQSVSEQFLHNITAYTPRNNLPPSKALALFLEQPKDRVLAAADPDLKNWLPENLWRRLHPEGVQQIVDYVYFAIGSVAAHLEARIEASTESNAKEQRDDQGDQQGDEPADDEVDLKSMPRMRG